MAKKQLNIYTGSDYEKIRANLVALADKVIPGTGQRGENLSKLFRYLAEGYSQEPEWTVFLVKQIKLKTNKKHVMGSAGKY